MARRQGIAICLKGRSKKTIIAVTASVKEQTVLTALTASRMAEIGNVTISIATKEWVNESKRNSISMRILSTYETMESTHEWRS